MALKIRKSKTDQLRKGNEVLIARTVNITCPVTMTEKYLVKANITADSEYVFRPLFRTKKTCGLIKTNKKLSYTRFRDCFLKRLSKVPKAAGGNFSLHSFRAGGATAAARNSVNDRCWKRHGRWRSDSSKNRYAEDSVEHRLLVSQNLGL